MQFRLFKLRLRRQLRHSQNQVSDIGSYTEAGLERHFFRRLGSLNNIWRFVTAWLLLIAILIVGTIVQIARLGDYYQSVQPVAGGIYSEGIYGDFTNANPIYATSEVDTTVSRLVFAGLLTYNNSNKLVGDLAESWEVDAAGTLYTVKLRPNLVWHDGSKLTADDVVFTFKAIQNPDAQSPLAASWQGITIAKKDATTVTFQLTNPLAAFPYSLTTGIVPAAKFMGAATSWRSLDFNSLKPVGAGPFELDAIQVKGSSRANREVLIALKPFEKYTLGTPKLGSFVVHTYADEKMLIESYKSKQLTAMIPPPSLKIDNLEQEYDFVMTAANMVFLNTSNGVFTDTQVRRALVQGTNAAGIQKSLGYPTVAVRSPLLRNQVGYDPSVKQLGYDVAAAKAALDKAGWLVGKNGIRYKDNKPLIVNLAASDSREHNTNIKALKSDWQKLGVQLNAPKYNTEDFQNTLSSRTYDAVLYGISIGIDPDVFVYWHSSQTDPRSTRLNLSGYKSATVDRALEDGRTRLDPVLRTIKYKPFLEAWQQDAPAIGLYQPSFQYLAQQKVYGLDAKVLNAGSDRLNNVQNWMVLTDQVTNQ